MRVSRRLLLSGASTFAVGMSLPGASRAAQSGSPAKPRYIDTHHHIIPDFWVNAVGLTGASAGTGRVPPWSVQGSLEMMDRSGIDIAVVSISHPGIAVKGAKQAQALARRCNDFAQKMITDHPGRFGAFGVLPLPNMNASLAELEYSLDKLELAGVVLLTNYDGLYLGDSHFQPLMAELDRRKTVVFVHPTSPRSAPLKGVIPSPIIEFPHDTTWAAASLLYNDVFAKYPGISFIFSHSGGTLISIGNRFLIHPLPSGHDVMALLKRQHYDVALTANSMITPALKAFVGADQIVFGSDYPFVPQENLASSLSYLATLSQSDPDFPKLARGTALSLLSRLGRTAALEVSKSP